MQWPKILKQTKKKTNDRFFNMWSILVYKNSTFYLNFCYKGFYKIRLVTLQVPTTYLIQQFY